MKKNSKGEVERNEGVEGDNNKEQEEKKGEELGVA